MAYKIHTNLKNALRLKKGSKFNDLIIAVLLGTILPLLSISITLLANTQVFDNYEKSEHNVERDDSSFLAIHKYNIAELSVLPLKKSGSRKGNPGVNTLSSFSPKRGQ